MKRLHTLQELTQWRRRSPGPVALVATMGALHRGHLGHVEAARAAGAASVVVSVFVNPTQFDDAGDLAAYPRTLEADARACASAGADALFAPSVDALYPPGTPGVTLDVPALTTGLGLEDAHRQGHFGGVARVVAKLMAATRPHLATFGRKDLQQLRLVQALAADLCLGVRIVEVTTEREPDGLAMSSRNARLAPAARAAAAALPRALAAAHRAATSAAPAERAAAASRALRASLAGNPALQIDYAEVRDARTLLPVGSGGAEALELAALLAVRVGEVRLIDNLFLDEPLPAALRPG